MNDKLHGKDEKHPGLDEKLNCLDEYSIVKMRNILVWMKKYMV